MNKEEKLKLNTGNNDTLDGKSIECRKAFNVNDEANAPTEYGKYVDECLNEASKHFFSEGEDKYSVADLFYAGVRCGKSWLENQAEQKKSYDTCDSSMMDNKKSPYSEKRDFGYFEEKPVDKVEPKFKVGDWVACEELNTALIVNVDDDKYEVEFIDGNKGFPHIEYVDRNFHLWTIQDAKEGDVLSYVTDEEDLWIMIYWSLYEPYEGHVHYHALLINDNFSCKGTCCICIDNLKPATKEQRDLFFQKMEEAGYEWDAEKKGLSCYMA